MSTQATRPLQDYTIGELLAEISSQDMSLVLTGTGNVLAMVGGAMLDRLGEKPEGKASVRIEVTATTKIVIEWETSWNEH